VGLSSCPKQEEHTLGNPNPNRITDAMWRLWEELHKLEPETRLGGIFANKPGYHNTRNNNASGNYSVRDAEDRGGPGNKAAALDWTFPSAQRGDYRLIAKYCRRLLASGENKNDERLNGWREFYGQADSDRQVEGWDSRYLKRITSDDSHLWHIHFSEDRDKVESWANKDALLSVLRGESVQAWRERNGKGGQGGGKPAPAPKPKPTGTRVKGKLRPTLKRGSKGEDVKFLQLMIGATADGDFGPKTEARVRWYQKMRGISVDGEVGPQTWNQINKM
jgi:hypothetical protein